MTEKNPLLQVNLCRKCMECLLCIEKYCVSLYKAVVTIKLEVHMTECSYIILIMANISLVFIIIMIMCLFIYLYALFSKRLMNKIERIAC